MAGCPPPIQALEAEGAEAPRAAPKTAAQAEPAEPPILLGRAARGGLSEAAMAATAAVEVKADLPLFVRAEPAPRVV